MTTTENLETEGACSAQPVSNSVKVVDRNVTAPSVPCRIMLLYRDANGSILGFGDGNNGRLGRGTVFRPSVSPGMVYMTATSPPSQLEPRSFGHGLERWFALDFWHQQLRTARATLIHPTNFLPNPKVVDANVTQVAAGENFTVFLKNDGSVWGMGKNSHFQLGDANTSNKWVPQRIIEANATSVACSLHGTFVSMNDGSLLALGHNAHFRMGTLHRWYKSFHASGCFLRRSCRGIRRL